MKIVIPLFGSLFLAVLFSLLLFRFGVFEWTPQAKIRAPAESLTSEKTPTVATAGVVAEREGDLSALMSSGTVPEENSPPEAEIDEGGPKTEHERILAFLQRPHGDFSRSVEDELKQYLTGELGMNADQVDRTIRRCFWMNFVTFQQEWRVGEEVMLRQSFGQERELKEASFAAMGLTLPGQMLEEAQRQLEELTGRLQGGTET